MKKRLQVMKDSLKKTFIQMRISKDPIKALNQIIKEAKQDIQKKELNSEDKNNG